MDTLTHGLAGYIVARTGLTRDTGRWGVVAGISASVFPDADFLGSFLGTEFTLRYHRGLLNSIFLVVPFSFFLAWLFMKISGKRRFSIFFLVCSLEILVHTLLDLLTSYGTMILSPFSAQRFALDWVFIIDPFLTATFFLTMIATLIWRAKGRPLARASVALAATYVAICACSHFWALSLTKTYARDKGLAAQNIASLPQPLSPFHWANYVVTEDKIYEGFVNLIGTHQRPASNDGNLFTRVWARYQPPHALSYRPWNRFDDSPWVRRALTLEGTKTFMWFARFPVAMYEKGSNGEHRVKFLDLRFGAMEGRIPFAYEVIFNPQGGVASQGFHSVFFLKD